MDLSYGEIDVTSSGSGASIASSAVSPFLRVFDKRKKHFQLADQISVRFKDLLGVLDTHLGSVEQFVRFTDGSNRGGGEILSFKCDYVHTSGACGETFGEHVRGHIL